MVQNMFAALLLCLVAVGPAAPFVGQSPAIAPVVQADDRFEITSVKDRQLWKSEGVEVITANDTSYLASESEPVKVAAVEITTRGNSADWIVVWKASSNDRPVKLREYASQKYIFEHRGSGLYFVQTQDAKGEPEFAEFTVGAQQPTEPTDPPVDPPTQPDDDLAKIIGQAPNEPVVAQALAKAYLATVATSGPLTVEQSKELASQNRKAAFASVPRLSGNWNEWLLKLEPVVAVKDKADYLAALTQIATALSKQVVQVQYQPQYRTEIICINGVCREVRVRR